MTVELADAGMAIKRQNLRRRHPDATEEVVDEMLRAWSRSRPFDAPGKERGQS
jgi:hypothetical protein